MIDATEEYLNTLEQDAIDHPKFDIKMHVTIYNCAGQYIDGGCVLSRWWHHESYYYEIWTDSHEMKTLSEVNLERLVRSQVTPNWLTVIKGGY